MQAWVCSQPAHAHVKLLLQPTPLLCLLPAALTAHVMPVCRACCHSPQGWPLWQLVALCCCCPPPPAPDAARGAASNLCHRSWPPASPFPPQVGRAFRFKERSTRLTTELRAGLITFLMVSYILAVNPQVLATTGGTCNPAEVCSVSPVGAAVCGRPEVQVTAVISPTLSAVRELQLAGLGRGRRSRGDDCVCRVGARRAAVAALRPIAHARQAPTRACRPPLSEHPGPPAPPHPTTTTRPQPSPVAPCRRRRISTCWGRSAWWTPTTPAPWSA